MRKLEVDTDVLTLAKQRIGVAFDRFDRIAVAFSGGKDSTVVLNLTVDVARERGKLPVEAFFWDEEAIHPDTIEYVQRVSERDDVKLNWLCLPIKHRNACSKRTPWWHCWAPEDREKWVRPLPPTAITELPNFERIPHDEAVRYLFPADGRTVGWLLGIRADESMRRFQSVTARREDNYMSQKAEAPWLTQVKPIYDWTTLDVWTAPKLLGWDHNHAYDVMTKAGIPASRQRVCAPYGEQPLENLWMYRLCWPELWAKMVLRVPGANAAMRYATTPIWGYGTTGRSDGESWEDAISRELQRWEPVTRAEIAKRIASDIRRHQRMFPGEPIPESEPTFDAAGTSSRVTWEFLFMVAQRGDTKGRKSVPVLSRGMMCGAAVGGRICVRLAGHEGDCDSHRSNAEA